MWPEHLARCIACGIVFSATLLAEREAPRNSNLAVFAGFEPTPWSIFFSRWKCRGLVARLTSYAPVGRLLEVGPGDGEFLRALRQRGFHTEGLDVAPGICRALTERLGIPMHCGEIQSFATEEPFDVVAGHHVIEHVGDPAAFLTAARRVLRGRGILFLTCPNIESLNARFAHWVGYQPYHAFYFGPGGLKDLVEQSGFRVLSCTTRETATAFWDTLYRSLVGATNPMTNPPCTTPTGGSCGASRSLFGNIAKILASALYAPVGRTLGAVGLGDEIVVVARAH